MNAQLDIEWRTDNQRLLDAEFVRLCALLGDGNVQQSEEVLAELREELQATSSIDLLAQLFSLNTFERDLLLLVTSAELNSRIAGLCSEKQKNSGRIGVSLGLAMSLFDNAYLSAIAPRESLRRWRLLEVDTSSSVTDARLRVDERILFFIGGLNFLDHRLLTYFEPSPQHTLLMAEAHRHIARQIAQLLQAEDSMMPSIYLAGDDRDSQLDVAIEVAESMDAALHVVHTADLPESLSEQEALIALWHREAALLGSGLVIIHDAEQDKILRNFVGRAQGFVVVVGAATTVNDKNSCTFSIDKPDTRSQRELWQSVLGDADGDSLDLNYLANQYRLNARRIDRIAQQARQSEKPIDAAALRLLCGGAVKPMDALAQRIESTTGWDDLVLPEGQLRILQQLVSHTHHRMTVHFDWGFARKSSRGLGVASLFSGESGTGKTMAAEVIANELGLVLYRIDLSAVVSKYIGETEKNLKKLFDAAEDAGAVLLFDEADALFGKRSDVKDSHDRYANIEVSYLLQRMEAYRGLAILTSNHRAALDVAFQRRLRFIVDFPFPDAMQREAIWRSVFPADTPISNLDYPVLARLNATGGSIRNIALNAAFMAAESSSAVTMALIQRAAQLEVGKSERTLSTAEIRGWV